MNNLVPELPAVLSSLGHEVKPEGGSYRIAGHGGLVFSLSGGKWLFNHFAGGKGGDAIDLIRRLHPEMTFAQAKALLDQAPKVEAMPEAAVQTSETLEARAAAASAALDAAPHVLEWLAVERGLEPATIARARLGCLAAYKNLPERLTIPVTDAQGRVKTIIYKALFLPDGYKGPRFYEERGCPKTPLILGALADRPVVIIESALDAWLLWQHAGGFCAFAALNGCRAQALPPIGSDIVLVALDSDEAGRTAAQALKTLITEKRPDVKALIWPVPQGYGKDPAEAWKAGLNLKQWLKDGIRLAESGETPPAGQTPCEAQAAPPATRPAQGRTPAPRRPFTMTKGLAWCLERKAALKAQGWTPEELFRRTARHAVRSVQGLAFFPTWQKGDLIETVLTASGAVVFYFKDRHRQYEQTAWPLKTAPWIRRPAP